MQARLRVIRRWILVQILLARVGKPHTQMACSPCAPGFVAPNASTAYCFPCEGGTYSANATACAPCPAGFYCPQGAQNATRCTDASSYCPAGSSTPKVAEAGTYTNENRTTTIACEEGFYCSRRSSPQVPIRIVLPRWRCQPHRHPRGHVHKHESNQRHSVQENFYCADGVQRPCPANSFGGPNLTSVDGCKPEEVATTSIVLGSLVAMLLVAIIIVYVAWRRSNSITTAFKVLMNPLFLTASGFLMEIFDALTDGVACANALNSPEPFFAPYRRFYLIFLVSSNRVRLVHVHPRTR